MWHACGDHTVEKFLYGKGVRARELFDRFESRAEAEFANRVLSALRQQFGGHAEKTS